jgi:hypothetical protein
LTALEAAWLGHPGYIVYSEQRRLMAQAVDSQAMRPAGDPIVMGKEIGVVPVTSMANFTVAPGGTILFGSLGESKRRLVWLDRNGKSLEEVAAPDDTVWPRLSPDGTRVALTRYPVRARIRVFGVRLRLGAQGGD